MASGSAHFPLYPLGCGIIYQYEEGTPLRYLLDLSLYQIQIFIKSAEFKNFTATASFFNTTQRNISLSG